jgi:3-oxoacyl-[acyl-carrier protein] reductase
MDLGLEGRVALVTGGSRGIGFGIAAGLAAEGARVAVAARNADRVREAAERIGGHGVVFDSGDLDAVPRVIASVEEALGPIDVYVANTGGPPAGKDPLGFTRADWEAAHRTLVLSPMTFLERLLPGMRDRAGAAWSRSARLPRASRSPRSSSPTPTGPGWSRRSRCWRSGSRPTA